MKTKAYGFSLFLLCASFLTHLNAMQYAAMQHAMQPQNLDAEEINTAIKQAYTTAPSRLNAYYELKKIAHISPQHSAFVEKFIQTISPDAIDLFAAAVSVGYLPLVKRALQSEKFSPFHQEVREVLCYVAWKGWKDIVSFLINNYNVDVNCEGPDIDFLIDIAPQSTPLYFAVAGAQTDIVRFLISKGAKLGRNTREETPLHYTTPASIPPSYGNDILALLLQSETPIKWLRQ